MNHRTIVLSLLSTAVGALAASPASAWSPKNPGASCQNVSARILRFGDGLPDVENDVVMAMDAARGTTGDTATTIQHERHLVANAWVSTITLHVETFRAGSAPKISWGLVGASNAGVTGAITAPRWLAGVGSPRSLQSDPARVEFATNGGKAQALRVGTVQACSSRSAPSAAAPAVLRAQTRVKGILLGTNDVVFSRLEANSAVHMTVAVWADDASNDFDVVAKCGSAPAHESDGGAKDDGAGPRGFLHLPPCASQWHVAVSSRRGAGGFNLVYHRHKPEHHVRPKVGTAGEPVSAAQLARLASELQKGGLLFFGATEGDQYIEGFDFYPNADCQCAGQACTVCYNNGRNTHPESKAWVGQTVGGTTINMWHAGWNPPTLAHELAHLYYAQPDEYNDGGAGDRSCGHSLMAHHHGYNITNVCSAFDHGKDPQPGVAPRAGTAGVPLAVSAGRSLGRTFTGTPDKYPYLDFRDKFAKVSTILANPAGSGRRYRIATHTCDAAGSGTDSAVQVQLTDGAGVTSGWFTLDAPNRQELEPHFYDRFTIVPTAALGDIRSVAFSLGGSDSWCVSYVDVTQFDAGVETKNFSVVIGDGETILDGSTRSRSYALGRWHRDFDGDGHVDFIARQKASSGPDSHKLWSVATDGLGWWEIDTRREVAPGWGGYTAILAPGDWSGDGKADLLARDGNGDLYLVPTNANGALEARTKIGTVWQGFDLLVAPGDWSGDGKPDVLARTAAGALHMYEGDGAGGFADGGAATVLPAPAGHAWSAFDAIIGPGDFTGDGKTDLVARTPNGKLYVLAGNGAGGIAAVTQPGTGWNMFDVVLDVGDFDGDGKNDLAGRGASDGQLYLCAGNGAGGFRVSSCAVVGFGWNLFDGALLSVWR